MNLRKRTNGIWMLTFRENGVRHRVSTGERDRTKAEQAAAAIMAGTHERAVGVWTLETALLDCYERVWKDSKSADHTHVRIMKLIRHFGPVPLSLIDYNWAVTFGQTIEREWGVGNATINRYLAHISKAMKEAVLRGKLQACPPMPYRKEPPGKLRYVTPDEEAALLAKCDELWPAAEAREMRALIVFLVDTGARTGEAMKLSAGRTEKFRLAYGGVRSATFVDTKNGGARTVPLTARATEAAMLLPVRDVKGCSRRFERLRNACGLPDVSLHTLRHTCASRLVQGGMDLYRVKEWLGHSSVNVTQRYAHLAPSSLDQGTDILSSCARREPIGEESHPDVSKRAHLSVVK